MTNGSIEDVLSEFFTSTSPDHVHDVLHQMVDGLEIGRLALLPRPELAKRAALAGDLKRAIDDLYHVLIATWGDDPNLWPLDDALRSSLGHLLSMHLATEPDHTSQSSVTPRGVGATRSSRRRERH